MSIENKLINANNALDQNNLPLAKNLIDEIEQEIFLLEENGYTIQLVANLGALMIDYGTWTDNIEIIKCGTQYVSNIVETLPENQLSLSHLYNLANGYSSIRKYSHKESYDTGSIPKEYINEKNTYRRALDFASTKKLLEHELKILPELLINYGNMLDAMGRPVEALDYYEQALNVNPSKPEALTNKAIILKRLALRAHGHTHLFIHESKRLLELALLSSPHPQLKKHIDLQLNQIQDFIEAHKGAITIKHYQSPKSVSKFHEFLRDFCFTHKLFLTPTTLIGKQEHQYFGDPLFISGIVIDPTDKLKTDRFIAFFNQIKQDYIFSRYLLVQSQFQASHADVIDQDVDYYYPLDYSIYCSYVEMLKVSYRLATDTLDKIAFFIKDYCDIESVNTKNTYFKTIFSSNGDSLTLRKELFSKKNNYLFGLMDLAIDLRKKGYYSFVFDRRNALTHRFLSVQTETFNIDSNQKDFPKVQLDSFIRETTQVLRLLKAAIIYLILFVDVNEKNQLSKCLSVPVFSTRVNGVLRWTPTVGDIEKRMGWFSDLRSYCKKIYRKLKNYRIEKKNTTSEK